VRVESRSAPDEALTCLSQLASSAGELYRQASRLSQWTSATAQQVPGLSYSHMMPLDKRLAMVEQLSEAIRVLARDGSRFRRLEAQALYAEGLTMAQLATVFGVSRQRVSALLRMSRDGTFLPGMALDGPAGIPPGDGRVTETGP
jgi:Homeodomain-like domain